ncbi:Crp/Fnr family transcriptional regulator [Desulfovibrio sp.]|uniref:Crp/Fnr family transcriptional regulator n=1 Tax=Desulfovibrio sp. TaxID=885 RepID=UPI003D138964
MFGTSSMYAHSSARRIKFYHECTKNCYLHIFSQRDVKELGTNNPELLLNLCQSYAKKVGLLAESLVSLSLESPLTRVCKYLASRIVPGSSPLRARRDISYREMADLLGMHRTSIHKVMRQWQVEGVWDFERNSSEVIILQPDVFFEEASMCQEDAPPQHQG